MGQIHLSSGTNKNIQQVNMTYRNMDQLQPCVATSLVGESVS